MYSKGGDTDDTYEPEVINPLDNLPEWETLENVDYVTTPNLEVTDQMAYGGNLFDGVSGTSKMKKKSRSSAGGLSIPDYQRKKAAYYRNELIKRGITNPVHLDAIIANMAVESSFNPGAADGTGAHGLM